MQIRFQHSPSTISTYHNQLLETLVTLSADIVRPYCSQDEVPLEIAQKPGFYWPYFKDCVGALYGTHIQCKIADDIGQRYRNRKGDKTWNVLMVVSFDGMIRYVNAGCEGSSHDLPVLQHSIVEPKFDLPHPSSGKYYLVDSTYPNTIGYLACYKESGVRYHIPEFSRGRQSSVAR